MRTAENSIQPSPCGYVLDTWMQKNLLEGESGSAGKLGRAAELVGADRGPRRTPPLQASRASQVGEESEQRPRGDTGMRWGEVWFSVTKKRDKGTLQSPALRL